MDDILDICMQAADLHHGRGWTIADQMDRGLGRDSYPRGDTRYLVLVYTTTRPIRNRLASEHANASQTLVVRAYRVCFPPSTQKRIFCSMREYFQ